MEPIDRRLSGRVSRRPGIRRDMLVRAVKVALVVGTGLTLINQADALFAGAPAGALWWKIPLTYSVPFCVSLYSSVATSRSRS